MALPEANDLFAQEQPIITQQCARKDDFLLSANSGGCFTHRL